MRRRIVWILGVGFALLGLAAVGAAVGWRDLRAARAHLVAARSTLQRAVSNPELLRTPAGRSQARGEIDRALVEIGAAQHAVHQSPALTASRIVPLVSRQRGGVAQLVDDSRTGALAARRLLDTVDRLASQTRLQEGRIPLDGMGELERAVRVAGVQVRETNRSTSGLWGSLHGARAQFDRIASENSTRLLRAADAIRASRSFLGAAGDRRYLIAVENSAEMRDQGAVLSYAVARVSGGQLVVEKHGPAAELVLKQPAPVRVPPGTAEVFGSLNPNTLWQSVNATADFAWSGRAMAAMFRQATAQTVDGVIAVDVPGLVPLLSVVGPVNIPGVKTPVTAGNASSLILHDLYEQFPAEAEATRQTRLADLATEVINRLHHGSFDVVGLGRDLSQRVAGGHLRLWSANATEERTFERVGLGGGPAVTDPGRTFHVAVENRTATKLDYYVVPTVREAVEVTKQGTAIVRTTVVIDNRAPVGAKPSYQLGPDEYHTTSRPGDYIAWVLLWAPAGSTPTGSVRSGSVRESGLVLNQFINNVAAGEKKTVSFVTIIPRAIHDGRLTLRFVPQPRLSDPPLSVSLSAPGWRVDGPASWEGAWDRVRTFSWGLGH